MESLSPQVVFAAKLPILNPNEFALWKIRIEQYFLMTDYSLWEVILNGGSPIPTRVIDDKHQLKFNIYKDAKSLMEAIEKRFDGNKETKKLVQKQTAIGKDESNPFGVDSLLKTIWYSMHHAIAMKHWLFQGKRQLTNDVVRFQALIDRRKVIITKDSVRQALRLDDVGSIDCLPNEEIFVELARMGYEKPSIKLTFYKAFFSSQWKFLIHIILQCMSAKRTTWNEFSSSMASAVICLATDQVHDDVADDVADADTDAEPTSLSPTPPPQQALLPLSSQVKSTPPPSPHQSPIAQPSSPLPQQPPTHDVEISMDLLNQLLETCATLVKKVGDLEQDKIAQAIEITKLKQREDASKQEGGIAKLDADEDVTLEEDDGEKDAEVQGRVPESQAQVYHLDLEHAQKVLIMQKADEAEPTEVEGVLKVVTSTKLMTKLVTTVTTTITAAPISKASAPRRRRGMIIQDPEEAATTSLNVQSEVKSKDKGKGILVEEPKPLKRQAQIEQDEAFARELEAQLNENINWNEVIEKVKRKEKQDNTVMRYQSLKRKPVTEAQERKNMMVYLKNMAGFKIDFFNEKEKEEEEIRLRKRNGKNLEQEAAKKQKIDEEVEELKTHLQIIPNDEDDVYTEATPLALKVPVVDYQIHTKHNKPYYKIIRADGTHQLFLSFISLLRNFDKEDLEMLWKIVQERFASSEPKNFSDDFLLNALKLCLKSLMLKLAYGKIKEADMDYQKLRAGNY
nr:ribonuclease H-like domain-containing protein [Tanacetum cinerariifolium]